MGAMVGIGNPALGAGISGAGRLVGLQEGGEVRGPGTETSDSIPARLSDREFVVNAESAQAAPGILRALNESPSLASTMQSVLGLSSGGLLAGVGITDSYEKGGAVQVPLSI